MNRKLIPILLAPVQLRRFVIQTFVIRKSVHHHLQI